MGHKSRRLSWLMTPPSAITRTPPHASVGRSMSYAAAQHATSASSGALPAHSHRRRMSYAARVSSPFGVAR